MFMFLVCLQLQSSISINGVDAMLFYKNKLPDFFQSGGRAKPLLSKVRMAFIDLEDRSTLEERQKEDQVKTKDTIGK